VQPADLGGSPPEPLPLERIVVVERGEGSDVKENELELDSLVPLAMQVLQEQRMALAAANADWRQASNAASADEARLLRAAFVQTPAQRIAIPCGFDAARAVETLADRIGIGP
jgi:malate synthase